MSNNRTTVSTSRLGPTTKPFSPIHQFRLFEQNYQSTGSELSSVKPFQIHSNNHLQTQRSPVLKENMDVQSQLQQLTQELEKMTSQNREMAFEVDRTRRKCEQLQIERNQFEEQLKYLRNVSSQTDSIYYNEFQQARAQSDEWKQRCQEVEMKVRQNSAELSAQLKEEATKNTLLQLEVERLHSVTHQKQAENDNLHQQLKQYVNIEPDNRRIIEQKEQEILTLQQKLKNLSDPRVGELQRQLRYSFLNLISQQKEQISYLENHAKQLEAERRLSVYNLNNEADKNQIRLLENQNSQLKEQIEKINHDKGNNQARLDDQSVKIALLSTEIDRLHQSLRQKSDEIQRLKIQLESNSGELERIKQINLQEEKKIDPNIQASMLQMSSEIERLNTQLRFYNYNINSYSREEKKKDQQEIDRLKTLIRSLELRTKEGEQKILNLGTKNSSLRQLLQVHVEENEQIKDMLNTSVSNEVGTWKRKFSNLNKEYHQVQETLAMTQAELEATKAKGITSIVRKFN